MEFDDLLDRVSTMLADRGRVSYAALRQYFHLSDDQVHAVREELVYARRVAVDENDRVLVASDGAGNNDAQQAERRHLTVMFVDMVGSSDLAAGLDPEDYREVVRTYQLTVASAIDRYHGYVAQYLGDGLLIYFGYPQAHEDDPRRAVFAGLDILKAIDLQNARLERKHGVRVVLRIGVHTGLVVVGEIGAGERQEALALGKTPNVAARLEAIAEHGTLVVSGHTKELLHDMFDMTSLGLRELKGIPGGVAVYRVDRSSGVTSPIDMAVKHKLLPLAGRREELAELIGLWDKARHGRGDAVLISGEAGIGKSRLAQALKEYVTEADNRWIVLRTSPYHGNTPLYPIISFWHTNEGISDTATPAQNLATLEASLAPFRLDHDLAVAAFAKLLKIPLPHERREDVQLRDVFEVLGTIVSQLVAESPRLMLVEDMQWADPSSIELIRQLLHLSSRAGLLLVMTARPEFDPDVLGDRPVLHMPLGPLQRADVEQMISAVAGGRTMTREVRGEIIRRTGGVPAFVEEFTRMLVESDWLRDDHGHLVSDGPMPDKIPETLKDSLMARLDRLGEAKIVAQQAAVLGRVFPRQLLYAVADMPRERVDAALDSLVEADVLKRSNVRGDIAYVFRHVLLQQAAYDAVLKSVRQQMHLEVANVLETDYRAMVEQQPERAAMHLTQAGACERAVGYWQWAGESAVERGAYVEARAHLEQGLGLLAQLPDTPLRAQRELSLLTAMGPTHVMTGGWAAPALGDIYSRVMALLAASGGTQTVDYQILGGLAAYHLQRGELATVHVLAERLLRQASMQQDALPRVAAEVCLAAATFFAGDFSAAREHCLAVVAQPHVPETQRPVSFLYGQEPAVFGHSLLGFGDWLAGDVRSSLREHQRAIECAETLSNAFSLCLAHVWRARCHYEMGDFEAALEDADFAAALGRRKDYAFTLAMADMVGGGCMVWRGDVAPGLDRLREGFATWKAGGNGLSLSYYCELLADAENLAGNHDAALAAVREGLAVADAHGEHFWRSELYRLQAALMVDVDPDAARRLAAEALTQAQSLGAPVLRVRAASALASLESDDGRNGALEALESALGGLPAVPPDRIARDPRALLEAGNAGRVAILRRGAGSSGDA